MEKFGPVKYAVLCKSKDMGQLDPENKDENQMAKRHKGNGFVKFKNKESADQLLELSRNVEQHLDEERKNTRLKAKQDEGLVSSLSLLKNEIELDGRRLIVKESISKEEASGLNEKRKAEDVRKKQMEDKRNLNMAKEGLLNEQNWLQQKGELPKAAMELRQRLYISKDKALKSSSNLFVSKVRLQIRNLPRREFFEPELKELMKVAGDEWSKTLSKQDKLLHFKNKKLLKHVKIMRDEEKRDTLTGDKLASGQAFVEFHSEDMALFAVRYLNNMEIIAKRGLIVDFAMEDQRALFKRKEKIDRWRQIAKDKKAGDGENTEMEKSDPKHYTRTVDLGSKK